jgi:hypothetical protein
MRTRAMSRLRRCRFPAFFCRAGFFLVVMFGTCQISLIMMIPRPACLLKLNHFHQHRRRRYKKKERVKRLWPYSFRACMQPLHARLQGSCLDRRNLAPARGEARRHI